MIRYAVPSDLDALCDMGHRFTKQSQLPLQWDAELARNTMWAMLHDENNIILVDDNNPVLGGGVIGGIERNFFVEPCAYIHKFFVEREFRGSGVSEELVSAFERESRERGANVIFAAATAGMGPIVEKLYVRLFENKGYSVLGRVLVKEL